MNQESERRRSLPVARAVAAVALLALAGAGAPNPARAQRPESTTELVEKKPETKPAERRVLELGKWYPSLEAGLTLSQSAYSDNWSGGDTGSLTWAARANSLAERQVTSKLNLWNSLKLAYGQTHGQSRAANGDLSWDRPDKSTDLIDLESIGRFTLGAYVDPYVGVRGESQFQDRSDALGRTLVMNPIRIRESAGASRSWIDTQERWLVSRLGFAARQNLRKQFTHQTTPDDAGYELQTTNDGGLEFVTDARAIVLEDRVTWTLRLGVYQPFFYSEKRAFDELTPAQLAAAGLEAGVADFTMSTDVELENIFSTQITKIVSVALYLRWVYDEYENSVKPEVAGDGSVANPEAMRTAIRTAGQFKQTLGIGLTYRFI